MKDVVAEKNGRAVVVLGIVIVPADSCLAVLLLVAGGGSNH